MNTIKPILEGLYNNKKLRNSIIPLFLSSPGQGKTAIIKQFAEEKGVNCVDILASGLMPHETSGMLIPIHNTKSMSYYDSELLSNLKDGDVLFFDELLNANPIVLNACLTLLENRTMASGKKLPEVLIVAAANPQGASIITPQIKERFVWYNVKFNRLMFKEYMRKYDIIDEIIEAISILIEKENFDSSQVNYYTPRSIEKALNMILNDIPTPYNSTLRPILEYLIENETGNDIIINNNIFAKNEKLPWLKLKKMMNEKLISDKVKLPLIYLVETEEDLKNLPVGIPFIRGDSSLYDDYVKTLEYQMLLISAIKSGLPFNWKLLLKENRYINIFEDIAMSEKIMCDSKSEYETMYEYDDNISLVSRTLEDISYVIDFEYLKNLKLIPSWFADTLEENIKTNIFNSILYNPYLYNKKLDNMSGSVELSNPNLNLIIIDISGSIPISISKSLLLLCKTLSLTYYADLLITGSKSTIYPYSTVHTLDIDTLYKENGRDNDQIYFKKLVQIYRKYDNVLIFGDNHSPCQKWNGKKTISITEGKQLCKWNIKKIYSFHVTKENTLAGYGEWFNCDNIEYMKNWVKYLN